MAIRIYSIVTLFICLLLLIAIESPVLVNGAQQDKRSTKQRKSQPIKKADSKIESKKESRTDEKLEPQPVNTPSTLSVPVEPEKNGHQWALLIGISNYPGQIQDLLYARHDAIAIRDALISVAGFRKDHIYLLTDNARDGISATKENIYSVLTNELSHQVKKDDEIIIFIAGHGFSSGLGNQAKSYFLPVDVDAQSRDTLEQTGIALDELSHKLSALKAKQFTLFVDACRDDPFPGRGIKGNPLTDVMARGLRITASDQQQAEPVTAVTFYSCRVGERAYESEELKHGIFTYFILSGIRALAARPDGRIEAGLLASYLEDNVSNWAKEFQQRARFAVEQTPTMITTEIQRPVIVMRVKPFAIELTAAPVNGKVQLITSPENANLYLNGQLIGKGPLEKELIPGTYAIRAELSGFQTSETNINIIAGYNQEISLNLKPLSLPSYYEKGEQFQEQNLVPQAIAAYEQALREDAGSLATYQRLAALYRLCNRYRDTVDLLMPAIQKFSDNAMLIAQYSRALSTWAEQDEKQDSSINARPNKAVKHNDARKEAIKSAELAIQKSANLSSTHIALGFAYLIEEKDRAKAIPIFVRASVIAPEDAEAYFGAGYGYRLLKQYQQAIPQLNKAVSLRPDYYEAQRELAYCYHALGDDDQAIRHYQTAASCRSKTSNSGEMAGNNLALSSLYQQKGQAVGGATGHSYTQAGKGYESDARQYDPTLKVAFQVLSNAGLSSRIRNYLPPDLNRVLDKIKVTDKIKIPFP